MTRRAVRLATLLGVLWLAAHAAGEDAPAPAAPAEKAAPAETAAPAGTPAPAEKATPAERAAPAEQTAPAERPFALTGAVSAGYRLVDVDGSRDKYDEDYNLHAGGRLFLFTVDGEARTPASSPLDRFHLEVDSPGDEPVSRFVLTAQDRQLWDLRVDFLRSQYFYAVPQLFAQPVPGDRRVDDLHDFDLTRTNGVAELRLTPPNLPTIILGYRLYQLEGDGTSTVYIPGGDTFVVGAPQRTVTHVGSVGTEFQALGTGVFLEQQFRRVNRTYGLHGPQPGGDLDPGNDLPLASWQSVQQQHLDIPITKLRLRRPVGDRVELSAGYLYARAGLSFDRTRFRDASSVIPTVNGPSTRVDHADGQLQTQVADLGTDVRLTRIATLHLAYRFDERTQDGDLNAFLDPGVLATDTDYHVRIHRVTADVELRPYARLSLRGGVRWARRDARFSLADQEITTDVVGAIAEARWKPRRWLDLFARYENVQVDDPWTIPGNDQSVPVLPSREIAYTFSNRGSAGVRLRPRDWVQLAYDFAADSFENADFRGRVQRFANTLSVSVSPVAGLNVMAGYTHRDLDQSALILIAPRYEPTTSLQDGSENVVTTTLTYDFRLLGQPWSTGWNLAWVQSDNALRPNLEPGLAGIKRYDLDRIDAGTFLTFRNPIIEPGIEVRRIEYDEPSLPRNDYDATIVVFRLTRRFDF